MSIFTRTKNRVNTMSARFHAPITRKQRLKRIGGAALAATGAVVLGHRLGRLGGTIGRLGKEAPSIPMKLRGNTIKMARMRHRFERGYTGNPVRAERHSKRLRMAGGGLMLASPTVASIYGIHAGVRGTRFQEGSERNKQFMKTASRKQKIKHSAQTTALGLGVLGLSTLTAPVMGPVLAVRAAKTAKMYAGHAWRAGKYRARQWKYRNVKGLPAIISKAAR